MIYRPAGRSLLVLLTAFCLVTVTRAATHRVANLDELDARLKAADPGDTVVIANGRYTTTTAILVTRGGTMDAPVTIAAESIGGVEIGGTHGFRIAPGAGHVTVRGFVFTHRAAMHIGLGADHCRVTRNVFRLEKPEGTMHFLVVDGDHGVVDRNEFGPKSWIGQMLKIGGATTRPAERTHVHHNYFHDFANVRANGGETIQVAVGENSMRNAYSLIEYNLFERCNGENELISNKSGSNVYRGNTFRDSPGGELTLRDGDNVTIEGNFFFNTAGTRLYGDDHKVFNNYFENCTVAILIGSGASPDHILGDKTFGGYDRVDRLRVTHNTLVNNQRSLAFQKRKLGAVDTVIANNVIVGDAGPLVETGTPHESTTWKANVLWGRAPDGEIPTEGFRRVDPLLAPAAGLQRVQRGSPLIDAAAAGFAEVATDLDGQPRQEPRDIGADEFSSAPVVRRPLTPADVGPASPL